MATTLTLGMTTLTLPEDLLWPDEFAWQPVQQHTEYSLTGALVVDGVARQAGRPITLQGGRDYAWMQRSVLVDTLNGWASTPGQVFTLTLRGVVRNVIFDFENEAIEVDPIADFSDPVPTDACAVTLRFLET